MGNTLLRAGIVAACLLVLSGCGQTAPAVPGWHAPALLGVGAQVGEVTVDAEALSSGARARLERTGSLAVVRQSALDWLDNGGHFAADGVLRVEVRVLELRLRSAARVTVLRGLGASDWLAATVEVSEDGTLRKTYAVAVTSALGGWEHRGIDQRLRRLARLLGRRVSEGL